MIGTLAKDWMARARAGAQMVANRGNEVEVLRNITYRTVDGRTLKLDIFRPRGETRRPYPGIVMIHGGSWRTGSKEQVEPVAQPFAQQGYVVASINYRLAPASKFPAQVEDAKAAVRWMRRHATEYGIDPKRIATVGFSAGAHLAAMLGTTGETDYLAGDRNDVSSRVQAVIAVSGPFDLYRFEDIPDEAGLAYVFGGTYRQKPQLYREASPILRVSKNAPPFLLIHGTEDTLVLPKNDTLMADALKKVGAPVEVISVKNAGHVLAPVDGKSIDPPYPVILVRVAAFMNKHLGR